MAENRYVHIDLLEAERLADLIGIQSDLTSAKNFAHLSLEAYQKERGPMSGVMSDALMTATLIRYARSFVGGVRQPLKSRAFAGLTDEKKRKHEWLLHVRNKYCAHSVNAFEENQPVARYWVGKPGHDGVESIGLMHTRLIGLGTNDFDAVIELSNHFLKHVEGEITKEQSTLLDIVKKIPLVELLAQPEKLPNANLPDPAKGRPRHGRTRIKK